MANKTIDNLFETKEDKNKAKIGLGVTVATSFIGWNILALAALGYTAFQTLKKPVKELGSEIKSDLKQVKADCKDMLKQVKDEGKEIYNDLMVDISEEEPELELEPLGDRRMYGKPWIYSRPIPK